MCYQCLLNVHGNVSVDASELDETGFFESGVGAFFVYGFYGSGGECQTDEFFQFWYVDFLFLQIQITAGFARGIELGGASPVGVAAAEER